MQIVPPPVPKISATTDELRAFLPQFAGWVSVYTDWANEYAEKAGYPSIPFIDESAGRLSAVQLSCVGSASIPDTFLTWFGCRRLREVFDTSVRRSSGSFVDTTKLTSSEGYVFANMVRVAAEIIANAPLSYEHREARRAKNGLSSLSVDSFEFLQFIADQYEPDRFLGFRSGDSIYSPETPAVPRNA